MELHNLIGLVGVGITLLAYFLLVTHKMGSHTYAYTLLNLVGSLMIMYSLFYAWNLSAFVMELSWFAVSAYGVYQVLKVRRK